MSYQAVDHVAALAGIGYTLATGRLFCDFAEFQSFCERLLERPIYTHEFADPDTWQELREAFEAHQVEVLKAPDIRIGRPYD